MERIYVSEIALIKLKLCNVFREPIEDERFVLQDFCNNIIKPHSNNIVLSHYAIILYYYGIHCRQFYDSITSFEMQERYAEHEKAFAQVIELRTQLVEMLEQIEQAEPPQIYLTNSQGKNRKLVFSLESNQNDIKELIVSHLKANLSELHNQYNEEEKQLQISDITLEFLKKWISESKELQSREGTSHMGRPLSIEMIQSHRCIQDLSFILRLDALLQDKNIYTKLSDITLSADDYRLIYVFLDFFGLLFYDKAISTTTQPDDIIKTRYNYLKKSNFPEEHRKDIEAVVKGIDKYSVDFKIKRFICKGIKVKN